ncbi:MAG: glutamyl-tRNA reductase [Gammaproteobacteria bacterium]|jgi:glutamyl-tRNA reductase
MPLLAFGINHKTAPIDVREKVAFDQRNLVDALHELTSIPQIHEAAILSTCNRTEILCNLEEADTGVVLDWFQHYHKLGGDEVGPYIYVHPEQFAVRHLLRVASGLDSLILGEPQIFGQMKEAYLTAIQAGTVGTLLGRLFQHTFAVAKQVRTDTAIGSSPVSVAFATVSLAKQIFTDLSTHTVLLIGAGETIELAARHLHEHRIGRMIIANRTVERAHSLASEFGGFAISLGDIPAHLAEADLVISSTASQLPILGKGAIERAIKARKHRPMLMIDIAVPRDIEPEADELDDVYLYTVDDLQDIIQEGLRSRQEAAKQADEIIENQVNQFMGWMRSLDAVATICAYREQAEQLRDQEVAKARRLLQRGVPSEQVLAQMARILTNKLIHCPSTQMRQAGFEGRTDVLDIARELFDLKDPHS